MDKKDIIIRLCQVATELEEVAPQEATQLDDLAQTLVTEPVPKEEGELQQEQSYVDNNDVNTLPQPEPEHAGLTHEEAINLAAEKVQKSLHLSKINLQSMDNVLKLNYVMDQINAILN